MAQLNINPIQWYEGMLLMPQHFQQADIRTEGLMTYYMSHVFSFYWGLVKLKIDDSLLASGIFKPVELELIMPDGLVISGLPQTSTALQLDISSVRKELESSPHFLYLCVPERHGDWTDVSGELPRYLSIVTNNVMDANTGEQGIDMPRLSPNMSLHVGKEPPAHYVSLPIAQVSYDSKSYRVTDYLPPQVQVDIGSNLGQWCNQLVQQLREKLGYLQGKVQSVNAQAVKNTFFEELEKIRLRLVVGLIPLEVILSTGKAHPFEIYKALCNLAAHISGVRYGEIPPRFKQYDHLTLRESFSEVINYIIEVLDEIEESYTVTPFALNERAFVLQLQSSWIGDRFVLGARAQSGITDEVLINWINNCVVVTDKYITLAKDNRVLGAKRTIVSEVPSMNLVSIRGTKLFIVEADRRYIDPAGVLCLFNMSDNEDTRPAEVVFYKPAQEKLKI